ncbi:Nitrate/nitrite transporter NarK, partial [hydrothermal vent metagenome]
GVPLATAGVLAGLYSLPASVFRALGGWMSDKWGARFVMYFTFITSLIILFVMSYPQTSYIVQGIPNADGSARTIEFSFGLPLWGFVSLSVILGFVMSLGKAAVYKHIPVYYPGHVGAVGGLVGMIGGLGGFVLPIAFGILLDLFHVWSMVFMLMFIIVGVSTIWMHVAIRRMERQKYPEMTKDTDLSDLPQKPIPEPMP